MHRGNGWKPEDVIGGHVFINDLRSLTVQIAYRKYSVGFGDLSLHERYKVVEMAAEGLDVSLVVMQMVGKRCERMLLKIGPMIG